MALRQLKSLLVIGGIISTVFVSAGCQNQEGTVLPTYKQKLNLKSSVSKKLDVSTEWQEVAKNNNLKMFLNTETLAVKIVNQKDGTEWSTNPDNPDEDQIADESAKELLKSQFILTYHDTSNNIVTMNSYAFALQKNQVTSYTTKNGVAVHYVLGDLEKDETDVPQKITDVRFKKAVLNKLSKSDKAELKEYYKYYESEKYWILKATSLDYIDRIVELLGKAGYTVEDLKKDNAEFGNNDEIQEKIKFDVVLEYSLTKDGMTVSVPMDKLRFSENNPITGIQLLNYLMSAQSGTNGYMVVPDGCGAIIDIDSTSSDESEITFPVYGSNPSIRSKRSNTKLQTVNMPVFGVVRDKSALLAILEDGASNATITVSRANLLTSYASISPSFTICNVDYVYIAGSETKSSVPVFNLNSLNGTCKVRYVMLSDDDADYVGMAKYYQEYLVEKNQLSKKKSTAVPLVLDVIGGVYGNKSFLGFSYSGVKAATTFSEAEKISNDLQESGAKNFSLKFSGWFNNGYKHDFAKSVSIDKSLGSKRDLKNLLNSCQKAGINFYPDVDLLQIYRSGNGFSPNKSAARYLDVTEIRLITLSAVDEKIVLGGRIREESRYLLSPSKFESTTKSFLNSYKKINSNSVSLRSMGELLYSDYREGAVYEREDTVKAIQNQLKTIKIDSDNILLNGANVYTWKYASIINNAPVQCSDYEIEREAIPFFQLVTHGYISQTGELINKADNVQDSVLHCIEYGIGLQYQVINQDSSFLKGTEYDQLYRSSYQSLKEEILSGYKQVSGVLKKIGSATISDHANLENQVYKTVYDNGKTVYVNYGTIQQEVDGQKIPAKGFLVVNS